jgi:hypothetical protein
VIDKRERLLAGEELDLDGPMDMDDPLYFSTVAFVARKAREQLKLPVPLKIRRCGKRGCR